MVVNRGWRLLLTEGVVIVEEPDTFISCSDRGRMEDGCQRRGATVEEPGLHLALRETEGLSWSVNRGWLLSENWPLSLAFPATRGTCAGSTGLSLSIMDGGCVNGEWLLPKNPSSVSRFQRRGRCAGVSTGCGGDCQQRLPKNPALRLAL